MNSRATAFIISFILGVPAIAICVVRVVAEVSAINYTAELRLADDASTPEKKSEYLGKFIAKLEADHSLPQFAAFWWQNEQNRLTSQVDVLKSLKQRCDDIAPLSKESMGYSQGMTQITGQEFDHSVDNCGSLIGKAYLIGHYGWFWMYAWLWLSIPLGFFAFVFFAVGVGP